MISAQDKQWMQLAIDEARKAEGLTSPNPIVGAVIVKENQLLGQGFHKKAGTPHAEVNAIASLDAPAPGATIYVTLEPCSTHGRTGPCTQAIIDAQFSRVVIGCLDPNPAHAGEAVTILEHAGLTVDHCCLEADCQALNPHFFHWITTGKPFVTLKMAMTLDGRIATGNGHSQWITGPDSRAFVQKLRQTHDAILVGGETVREDNPSLTVREPADWPRQPQKIILSSKTRRDFHKDLNIFKNNRFEPLFVKMEGNDWTDFLDDLGRRQITSLLIEGGGEIAAMALNAGIVNKIHFMIAPKILGGKKSRPVVGGPSPQQLTEALNLAPFEVTTFGNDLMLTTEPLPGQNPRFP